ncbi:hypothetical protein R1sor_009695 [Riccia sorocarpa]|uniref:Transposase n=1 Tax=Riccia sorocarpa TaxID=122646 RepID=A0ABD3HXU8_9MARC
MEVERDCRHCNKSLPIEEFSKRQRRTNVTKVHLECNVCFSSRQTTRLYEPVPDTPNEELVVKTCTYEQLSHMALVAFLEAAIEEVAIYQHWVMDCSEEYMEALTSWEGSENPRICFKKWVDEVVRPEVEAGSGLYWELRTWGRSAYRPNEFGATMRCVSRQDRVCVKQPNSAGNRRTSEKRRAIERFRCQGELRITLDTSTAMCLVTCIHLEDHERPCWRDSKFPREALEFLDIVTEAGMMTADVYCLLQLQDHIDPLHIIRAQVNYWVAEIESWRYGVGEPDQLKSSKDFIERPENHAKGFELILYEETDDFEVFSFLTPFWRYVSTVKEVLTDSTFKTNDMRFEMFALIGNLGGFGVPLCYMFFLKKTSVDESTPNGYQARGCRKGLLYEWMCKLRDKGLRPAFFITDKDACQIEVAQRLVYLLAKKVVGDVKISLNQFQKGREFPTWQTMRPELDPWYEQPAYVQHAMLEDIGIGRIDLNEDPIEMIPADDPETEDGGADENVAAIAGLLAKVNVSDDEQSAEEAAPRPPIPWLEGCAYTRVGSIPNMRERTCNMLEWIDKSILESSDTQVPVGVGWEANSNICARMYELMSAEVALRFQRYPVSIFFDS